MFKCLFRNQPRSIRPKPKLLTQKFKRSDYVKIDHYIGKTFNHLRSSMHNPTRNILYPIFGSLRNIKSSFVCSHSLQLCEKLLGSIDLYMYLPQIGEGYQSSFPVNRTRCFMCGVCLKAKL